MDWVSILLWSLAILVGLFILFWIVLYLHVRINLLPNLFRIFEDPPLFNAAKGDPVNDAEDVTITTEDGLNLKGCYLKANTEQRLGVILFGVEFRSNRWSCTLYTQFLRDAGFDVFSFDYRNQGESDQQQDYQPLQWVTDYEIRDYRAAIQYLKTRSDADPTGIGFFGISKGGSAGLMAAAEDAYVRCLVTDGIFATHTTMLPYMQRWITIYSRFRWLQKVLPRWYYMMFAKIALKVLAKRRNCHFPKLEEAIPKVSPRPLFMIHGQRDNYIKPEMAETLFKLARDPKELWIVPKAKHNQAFHVAHEEYAERVQNFFQNHLTPTELPISTQGTIKERSPVSPMVADT